MKPEEMERQESTKNVFNAIQEGVKEYKSLAWRNLDENAILTKMKNQIEAFLTRLDVEAPVVEAPIVEESVPTMNIDSEAIIAEPELGNNGEPIVEVSEDNPFDDSGLYDDDEEEDKD